ncbi:MAG: mechanosensitive ion channel family protein [Mariniblastus sp.]
MLRATRKLPLLAIGAVGFLVETTRADEIATATSDIVKESAKHSEGFVNTITAAFSSGPEQATAQNELIAMAAKATFMIAILYITYLFAAAIGRYVGGMVTKKVDATLGKFLTKAVRNVIMIVVGLVVLKYYDVNVAEFAIIFGAVGFAVGMALQGTLGNFAAGVMLLIFRPFKIDDYIVVAGTEGTVEEIDLFTTRLNALDNRHLIIPNGEIFGAKLENYSRNPMRRVDVNVGAAYSADIARTRIALEKAVTRISEAYTQVTGDNTVPSPQVYLMELGASSVDWQLRVWCNPVEYWGVREELTAAAKDALDKAGISIPFPQMDVHVVGKVMAKAA